MPKLAGKNGQSDSDPLVSYTPAGLFNHTAAIYQMTGYTPDRVSPSGQPSRPQERFLRTMASRSSGSNLWMDRCCRS